MILALKNLHSKSFIHFYIKPENLINSQAVIKLADFGWSAHGPNDRRKIVCDTVDYLAPELVNRQIYGKKVDIERLSVLT